MNVGMVANIPPPILDGETIISKEQPGLWERLQDGNRVRYDKSKFSLDIFKQVISEMFYKKHLHKFGKNKYKIKKNDKII